MARRPVDNSRYKGTRGKPPFPSFGTGLDSGGESSDRETSEQLVEVGIPRWRKEEESGVKSTRRRRRRRRRRIGGD